MLFTAQNGNQLLHGGYGLVGHNAARNFVASAVEVTAGGTDQAKALCPEIGNVVAAIVGGVGSGVEDLHTVKQLGLDDIERIAEGVCLNDEHSVLNCKGTEAIELHLVHFRVIVEELFGHTEHKIIVVATLKAHFYAEEDVDAATVAEKPDFVFGSLDDVNKLMFEVK